MHDKLLNLAYDMGYIEALEWVLKNCSGGGDWRRQCIQKIAKVKEANPQTVNDKNV